MLTLLRQMSTLFWQLVRLDIRTRYFSSRLGLLLVVAQPLALLMIYSWVFGDLMQLKHSQSEYFSEYLLAGLIVFNALIEVLNRAPSLIPERRELLLNTPLPVFIIPWIPVASSLVLEAISVLMLLVWMSTQDFNPFIALMCYLPWLLIRLLWSSAGAMLLSVLGVVIPDLRQVISPLMGILLLISPIFYRLEQVPTPWQSTLNWNPLTHLVQGYQQALVLGQLNVLQWSKVLIASIIVWVVCWLMAQSLLPKVRYLL